MLKIKDSVDLKELEKFGFYTTDSNYFYNDNGIAIRSDKVCRKGILKREITMPHCLGHKKKTLDNLYDLIQAGLVEKVKK